MIEGLLVDEEDRHLLDEYRWFINAGYVRATGKRVNGKQPTLRLHRLITNAPKGMVVDHINGNKLDNRKSNLRVVMQVENTRNKHAVKGHYFHKASGKWAASFCNQHLGLFDTAEEALSAYSNVKRAYNTERING